MTPLCLALLALCTLATAMRDEAKLLGAWVLMLNWIVNTAFCWATGADFPWLMFMTIDYLSGLTLIGLGRSRWHYSVAAIYALQMICHSAFGYVAYFGIESAAKRPYWEALYWLAWAQVAVMFIWIGYDLARHRLGTSRRVPPAQPRAAEEAR